MARADAVSQRRSFASLENALELPNLIDIQRLSFQSLVDPKGGLLRETIEDGWLAQAPAKLADQYLKR